MQKVLITGITGGIGNSIAEKLLGNKSYQVYGTTTNFENIKKRNENIEYLILDLGDDHSINKLLNELDDIDILINNAGIAHIGAFEDIPMEKFKEIFEINFLGAAKLIKYLSKGMINRNRGNIINIGSMVDKYPLPYLSGYVASKMALAGFTFSLRLELKEYNIKVSLISPSDIHTKMKPKIFIRDDSKLKNKISAIDLMEKESMKVAPNPDVVAKLVLKILASKNPKPEYVIGNQAWFYNQAKRILSNRSIEKIITNQILKYEKTLYK